MGGISPYSVRGKTWIRPDIFQKKLKAVIVSGQRKKKKKYERDQRRRQDRQKKHFCVRVGRRLSKGPKTVSGRPCRKEGESVREESRRQAQSSSVSFGHSFTSIFPKRPVVAKWLEENPVCSFAWVVFCSSSRNSKTGIE